MKLMIPHHTVITDKQKKLLFTIKCQCKGESMQDIPET